MKNILGNSESLELLESTEFDSLIEAAEMVTKAQNNISQLTKSINELRELADASHDVSLNCIDQSFLYEVVDSMEKLVDSMIEDSFLDDHIE